MDDIQYPSDLTREQIQTLVESIQDAFGGNFTRAAFVNHLLALLEDVPGFETGDVPASLIDAVWAAYRGEIFGLTLEQTARPLFLLGQVVATREVHAHLELHHISIALYLDRHVHGDWGSVPDEDARANRTAIEQGARILSSYDIAGKCVWIITEADRSVTTMLFPSEY